MRRARGLLALGIAAAAIVLLARAASDWPVGQWLEGSGLAALGPWSPLAFVGIYVLGTVALLPGLIFNLAAGSLYGFVAGSLVAIAGSSLGAVAAFLVARMAARRLLGGWMRSERVRALDAAIARRGMLTVILARLAAGIPFNLLNYAFGLTRVSLKDFALGSALGMAPYRIAYAYLGAAFGRVSAGQGMAPVDWLLLSSGLVATAVLCLWIRALARQSFAADVSPRN